MRATGAHGEIFNREVAMDRVDGDIELMTSLIDIFFEQIFPMMEAVRAAVQNRDTRGLERAAHRLKGSVHIFEATTTTEAANRLEQLGHNGDLGWAPEFLNVLEEEVERLRTALAEFRQQLSTSSR